MITLSISEFIGRLHPALVHLPIGILLTGCFLQWLSLRDERSFWRPTVNVVFLLGVLSALASILSGYLLSLSGSYDEGTVSLHMWMAISMTVIAILVFIFNQKRNANRLKKGMIILLLLLVAVTGHLGGTLTHGSDFLTEGLEGGGSTDTIKTLVNVQNAEVYTDIIQPMLKHKCYSCHSKSKHKGDLRMDTPELLLKGGKDGLAVISGDAEKSEMIKRILLPREHDDHMPPKEKPQMNEKEIALLHWWINAGIPFSKKVSEIPQDAKIKPVLLSLQSPPKRKADDFLPKDPVEAADKNIVDKLRDRNILVLPVARTSNYIMADFISARDITVEDFRLLSRLQKQLVSLKVSNRNLNDTMLNLIGKCNRLIELQLDHSGINDNGIAVLAGLKDLKLLNLVGTKVSLKGLSNLKGAANMSKIFLFQTDISAKDTAALRKLFPHVTIELGGYSVPLLPTDTMIVKPNRN